MRLYSIYDRAVKEYGRPFASINDETAKRECAVVFSNPNMRLVAQDSVLDYIGEFDTKTGVVTCENPTRVLDLCDLVKGE